MLILEQIVGNIASLSKAAFRKIVQKVFQKTPTQAHPVIHNMSVTYRYRIVIVSKSPIPKKILMHKEVCKNLASSIHGKVLLLWFFLYNYNAGINSLKGTNLSIKTYIVY